MRLFVAAYPPRASASAWLDRATSLGLPGRPTPVEQVHLTLQFIGDTPHHELDDVIESVARSVSGLRPVVLRVVRLMTLPEIGAARLLAAGPAPTGDAGRTLDTPPTLREMHRRLAQRLARRPRADAAESFTPHLTLWRFPAPIAGLTLDAARTALNDDPWTIDRVRLMRSILRPGGAVHAEIASAALDG